MSKNPYPSKFPTLPPPGSSSLPPPAIIMFTVILIPITAAAVWVTDYGEKHESELDHKLREKYGEQIQVAESKDNAWSGFMEKTIRNAGTDPEEERKFQEILRAGKETKKRHFAVDKDLYGTQKGAEERDRLQELYRLEREEKKKKKKKKKAKKSTTDPQKAASAEVEKPPILTQSQSTAVVVAAVASVAAMTTFLVGGIGRRP